MALEIPFIVQPKRPEFANPLGSDVLIPPNVPIWSTIIPKLPSDEPFILFIREIPSFPLKLQTVLFLKFAYAKIFMSCDPELDILYTPKLEITPLMSVYDIDPSLC